MPDREHFLAGSPFPDFSSHQGERVEARGEEKRREEKTGVGVILVRVADVETGLVRAHGLDDFIAQLSWTTSRRPTGP